MFCWNLIFFFLFRTNSISNSQIRADALNKNCLGVFGKKKHSYQCWQTLFFSFEGARLFLFFSFLFLFGSLIASAWVLFGYYISSKRSTFYPGLAIFIQNLAIFIRFVWLLNIYFQVCAYFLFFQHIIVKTCSKRRCWLIMRHVFRRLLSNLLLDVY